MQNGKDPSATDAGHFDYLTNVESIAPERQDMLEMEHRPDGLHATRELITADREGAIEAGWGSFTAGILPVKVLWESRHRHGQTPPAGNV
jgi:hypothetical protein